MTEYARKRAANRKPPTPAKKPKQRISRQRRKRMDRDAEYLALRDIYLEQNPDCVCCGKPATQVHHIVGGTAGRARSLLNSDTWLAACSIECHKELADLSKDMQCQLKCDNIEDTIARLRA